MFSIKKDINWDLFTKEERKRLLNCYNAGEYYNLCCLPEVPINTQEKETEIEKIVLNSRDIDMGDESEVRQELEKFWGERKNIETPEDEKKWQAKIDEEQATQQAKLEEEKQALEPKEEVKKDIKSDK